MINPEDNIPVDDSQNNESDDQQSQKDIHSNGLNTNDELLEEEQANPDLLRQAFDASEASYTLDVDKGIAPKKE